MSGAYERERGGGEGGQSTPVSGSEAVPPWGGTGAATRRMPVHPVVVRLTLRVLLGRRRGLLFVALPAVVLLLAVALRWAAGVDHSVTAGFLSTFAIATVLPLLALVAGTGVIGPEIDDGSIVYLLAKPVPRWHIAVSKLLVAVGCVTVFGAVPVAVAALIMSGTDAGLALGFFVGAVLAGIGYCAVFLLLAVVSRHAVVIGLVYALVWESLIGNFVPGVQTLSVQQWALSITREIVTVSVPTASVGLRVAVPALIIVSGLATWYAGRRLRSLSLAAEE